MTSEARVGGKSLAVLATFALLSACATGLSTRPAARVEPAVPAESEAPSSVIADETTEAPETGSLIAGILAERRRGDYPEIELWESGFTITEKSRINGQARTDYERALSLLGQERYEEGISVLRTVTETAPDLTAPYINLGIAYGHVGDLEQAEQALETAALLSPDNPIVQNELGILYRRAGRFADARASYESALAVYQGFHFARRNLGVLCDLYLGDLECALENYRAYLDLVGNDPEVEIWVADIENRLGF